MTIAELKKAGADLSASRETIHYLYLPTQETAQRAEREIVRPERHIEVRPAATGTNWLVLVKQNVVVNSDRVAALRAEFEAVAATFGGEYDGWEAAV